MSESKEYYVINWDKLVHMFNENNVSQLTQSRIAKAYGVTTATISLCKTRPMSMTNVDLYRDVYDEHFKETIELDRLLIKTQKNGTFK